VRISWWKSASFKGLFLVLGLSSFAG